MRVALEIAIILVLILANGLFAMAEIAIVAAKSNRLKKFADAGDAAAKTALELANAPTRFLASIQIGITLIGVLAAAFAALPSQRKSPALASAFPRSPHTASGSALPSSPPPSLGWFTLPLRLTKAVWMVTWDGLAGTLAVSTCFADVFGGTPEFRAPPRPISRL